MRVSKQSWMVLAAILAVAAGAAAVASESHRHGPFAGHGPSAESMADRHFERLADYLDLSESQRQELQARYDEHVRALEGRFEQLRSEFESIHEMAEAESPDPAAIGERVLAMHREHASLEAQRESFHAEVEALLTPEQAERFAAWRAARSDFEEDGPGHCGPHGH